MSLAGDEGLESDFQRISRERGIRSVQVAWHADYISATQIGWRIAELDRAVRRTAAGAHGLALHEKVPPPGDGGLAFVDAAPGSADILFEVFGFVRQVLDSGALDVILTAIGLTGAVRKVWGFVFRNRDPLRGVTATQTLEILRRYREMQGLPEGADPIGTPPPDSGQEAVTISVLVENKDGSRTIMIVQMAG